MQKTVNLLRGFVKVEAECPFPEQFLNMCAGNGVAFWSAERVDGVRIQTAILARDLPHAERFALRLGGTLTPLSRHGTPFFLERFKKRYVLIAGLCLCIAALMALNQYIWDFTVEGNDKLTGEEILQALTEIGISAGTRASAVDIETVRNQMLLKMSGLSWITVNVTGSHASVVVRERDEKPEIFARGTPVNVIAEKAGLVTRMDTLSGSAHVFPGDTVQQGQLLVSGLVDSAQLGVRLVNARAQVTARTWTELSAVVPTGAVGKHFTGRSDTRRAIVFGRARVNLYRNASQPYAMYDKMSEVSALKLPGGLTVPAALVREVYSEYLPVSYQMCENVAEDALEKALREELGRSVRRGRIVSEKMVFRTENGLAWAVLSAESEERIDASRKIEPAEVIGLP
jgi:similar to stage IV sporulation protein